MDSHRYESCALMGPGRHGSTPMRHLLARSELRAGSRTQRSTTGRCATAVHHDGTIRQRLLGRRVDRQGRTARADLRPPWCQQLQVNALNAETLLDAKVHPEAHGDLMVRVWGWSGYFCELAPEYQDHVIARHLHAAM